MKQSPLELPLHPPSGSTIGARFRVERTLGRGGMGEVLAVVEAGTGNRFALKRLLPGAKPRHAMLLQREFHTLASLRHPNIVRAFDFGTIDGAAYYTMELLAGTDVESLAPMPWTDVVATLRDVAAALSLIHARRLVHRDVAARNVWRSPEGTVKLIDFGALTNFGTSTDLAGTPPYVAPEAMRTRVLDHRSDLFSLGALAYFLLTGRHAYPARNLSELEGRWALGHQPIATRLSDMDRAGLGQVPEALEQLVEALLASAPDARPASSAEVLDTLNDVQPGIAAVSQVALEGMIASKEFVGRSLERKRLHAKLRQLEQHTGACVALVGPRGAGRSRLLAEFAVEARLTGHHVVEVSGSGAEPRVLGSAARSVLRLLEVLPDEARPLAMAHAAVLAHVSEEVRTALGVPPEQVERFPALAGEARLRIQAALQSLWTGVCRERPVVLLLDDLQAMDEASLALFSTLARDAREGRLLLVATVSGTHAEAQQGPVQAFLAKSQLLALRPLGVAECEQILHSIFGDVEHLARTAQHLCDAAEGNPARLMDLCAFLVHTDKVRCIEGTWVLPQEPADLAIPASFDQLDDLRLARLSAEATALARTLSVVEGEIPMELCSVLSCRPVAEMFDALEELSAAQVLKRGESGYAFCSQKLRLILNAQLASSEAETAHRLAGEAALAMEGVSQSQRVVAGLHLMKGGEPRRGAEVVHQVALEWTGNVSEDSFHIGHSLESAYSYMRELQLCDAEKLAILSSLASAGFFTDRRLGFAYGDEALRCGRQVCGMDLARRLAPWLGRKLGLIVALIVAGARLRRAAKRSALVPDLEVSVRLFMTAAGSLAGMYTLCLARDKVLDSARAIEPLTALGSDHVAAIVYQFAFACAATISDRNGEARERWRALTRRLEDPRPIKALNETSRDYYRAASMYAWGGAECWSDRSRSIEIAEWLDHQPLKLYQLSADQVRAQYYAQQGKSEEVASCRARVELRAMQRGMTWQVELWWPCTSVALATRQRDAIALKRAAGQLANFGADTPTLRDFIDYARASYLLLRGRAAEAVPLLESLLARRGPDDIGHANIVGLLASGYNATGRFQEAERIAFAAIAQLRSEDFDAPGLTARVRIEWSLALANQGRCQHAAAELDAMIAHFLALEGPLTLGALYDARAQVAVRAGDGEAATRNFEHMACWYRKTDCSSLLQYCDQVARRWNKLRAANDPNTAPPGVTSTTELNTRVASMSDAPDLLLAQVVRGAMAREGVLMCASQTGETFVFKTREGELPAGLVSWIEERIEAAHSYRTETQDSDDGGESDPNAHNIEDSSWRLHVLYGDHESSEQVIGGVALCSPVMALSHSMQRAIAATLSGATQRFVPTGEG